jgi:hypothetical protein
VKSKRLVSCRRPGWIEASGSVNARWWRAPQPTPASVFDSAQDTRVFLWNMSDLSRVDVGMRTMRR